MAERPVVVRLLGYEGETWKNWTIPKFQDRLLVPLIRRPSASLLGEPRDLSIRTAEFHYQFTLGPEDGGPLHVYRRVR